MTDRNKETKHLSNFISF